MPMPPETSTAASRPLFLDAVEPEPEWEPPVRCTRCRCSEGLHWEEENGKEGCDGQHGVEPCGCPGFRERQPAA